MDMMNHSHHMGGPRLSGIHEHLERVQFLFALAEKEKDPKAKYRLLLATTYSCRAITELMLEAAEKQEVRDPSNRDSKITRNNLEAIIAPKLPYYSLIERIRIHDFHRFGILPPDPTITEVMYGGPVKLTVQKGLAGISLEEKGPKMTTTGNSKIDLQRPLLIQDGKFFDDDSTKYVKIEDVLKAFLREVSKVISQFEKLLTML